MADDNVSDFEIDFTEDSEEILRRLLEPFATGEEDALNAHEGTYLYDLAAIPATAFGEAYEDLNEIVRQGFLLTATADTLDEFGDVLSVPRLSARATVVRVGVECASDPGVSPGTVLVVPTVDGGPVPRVVIESFLSSAGGWWVYRATVEPGDAPYVLEGAMLHWENGSPPTGVASAVVLETLVSTSRTLESDDDYRSRLFVRTSGALTANPARFSDALSRFFPNDIGDTRMVPNAGNAVIWENPGDLASWGPEFVPVFVVSPDRTSASRALLTRDRVAEIQRIVNPSIRHWLDPIKTHALGTWTNLTSVVPRVSSDAPGGTALDFQLAASTSATIEIVANTILDEDGNVVSDPVRIIGAPGDVVAHLAIDIVTGPTGGTPIVPTVRLFDSAGRRAICKKQTGVTDTNAYLAPYIPGNPDLDAGFDWTDIVKVVVAITSDNAGSRLLRLNHVDLAGVHDPGRIGLSSTAFSPIVMSARAGTITNPLPLNARYTEEYRRYFAERSIRDASTESYRAAEFYEIGRRADVEIGTLGGILITVSQSKSMSGSVVLVPESV